MADPSGQTVFAVSDLSVTFTTLKVVKDASFSVQEGSCLGIIGSTGSGKTLMLLSALGLQDESATVDFAKVSVFDHEEVQNLLPKRLAVVFQNASMALNPIKKCGVQISRILRKQFDLSKAVARARTIEALAKVKLGNAERVFNSYPHEVSGGELQRVMIAMALACDPDILILDEPTASLDKVLARKIKDLLQDLQASQQLSMIVISHDLEMVADLADQIMHVHDGEILTNQSKEDFFQQPGSDESRSLIEAYRTFRSGSFVASTRGQRLLALKSGGLLFPSGKYAFENIDLEIFQNEKLGIIGESGSGKSSLAKCLSGILDLTSGEIQSSDELGKISYIFQDAYNSVDPDLSVRKIINEVLRLQDRPQAIEAIMESVSLSMDLLERKIHQLSGGQRQRVNLARGLAANPQLLICDEITSGLDLKVQFQIIEMLKEKFSGLTILFISHDISLVKYFCDRLIIMKDGSIVNRGGTDEIFNNNCDEYTNELINSVPNVNYFLNI